MKSLIQNINNGNISIIESEIPIPKENQVLVKTIKTLISTGTEKMLIDFGKSNIINKIHKNRDKVGKVIEKFKSSGLSDTYGLIEEKLNTPIQIGYSNIGIVEKSNCEEFKKGDKVVSNGFHSEYCVVEKNLCVKIPEKVNENDALFSILASISLNGIRKCKTQINENIVIYGFGLIGIITAKLLENLGVNIIIIDNDENKRIVAEEYGYSFYNPKKDEIENNIKKICGKHGADSIIICTYTKSNEPIIESLKIIRKKGKIIIIGICGLELSRDLMYDSEVEIQVSKSYGPGRYEYSYEKLGIDLPYEHVRWTQKRNIESILKLISKNKLNFKDLVDQEFAIEDFENAYKKIEDGKATKGIIFKYNQISEEKGNKDLINKKIIFTKNDDEFSLDCIGAGNHCKRILLPIFKRNKVNFQTLCGDNPTKSEIVKKKFNFKNIENNEDKIFESKVKNFIIIATPHHLHSDQIVKAIKNRKSIFIEKPLAINQTQLNKIYEAIKITDEIPIIHTNFNRRYSFFASKMKSLLNNSNTKSVSIDINSPEYTREGTWLEDKNKSGGSIIGEACHFIDLSKFIVGEKIKKYSLNNNAINSDYNIHLEFDDGSISDINYYFSGNRKYPKEMIKVYSGNSVTIIDDFKKIKHFGKNSYSKNYFFGQDKGHSNSIISFLKKMKTENGSIDDLSDVLDTSKICIELSKNC